MALELKTRNIKTNERYLRNISNYHSAYSLFIDFISFLPIYNQLSYQLLPIRTTVSAESKNIEIQEDETYYVEIFTKISYSHFVELIKIKENTKRKFYELSTIK